MNSYKLRFARTLLVIAAAVTGFIVRHSGKITAAAVVVNHWALNAIEKAAWAKVTKITAQRDELIIQAGTLYRLADTVGAQQRAAQNKAWEIDTAVWNARADLA